MAPGEPDGVELICPDNLRAVTGGFASTSPLVVGNGTSPGDIEGSWIIEVTNLTEAAHQWQPNVTCI